MDWLICCLFLKRQGKWAETKFTHNVFHPVAILDSPKYFSQFFFRVFENFKISYEWERLTICSTSSRVQNVKQFGHKQKVLLVRLLKINKNMCVSRSWKQINLKLAFKDFFAALPQYFDFFLWFLRLSQRWDQTILVKIEFLMSFLSRSSNCPSVCLFVRIDKKRRLYEEIQFDNNEWQMNKNSHWISKNFGRLMIIFLFRYDRTVTFMNMMSTMMGTNEYVHVVFSILFLLLYSVIWIERRLQQQ